MKRPEEVRRSLVEQWILKADQDFGVAQHLNRAGALYPEAIGFHCQQAIEKYLKAFLTQHSIEFPKTHNLVDLRLLAGRVDESLMADLAEVTVLNPYGVEVRYPGDMPEVLPGDATEAFSVAEAARNAILSRLANGSSPAAYSLPPDAGGNS